MQPHNPINANLFLSSPFFIMCHMYIIWKVLFLCQHSSNTIQKHPKHIFQHFFHWWIIHITYPGMKETTQQEPSCKPWQQPPTEFPHVYAEGVFLTPPTPQTPLNLDTDANMELMVLGSRSRQWEGLKMVEEFDVFMNNVFKTQPIPLSIINFYHLRPSGGQDNIPALINLFSQHLPAALVRECMLDTVTCLLDLGWPWVINSLELYPPTLSSMASDEDHQEGWWGPSVMSSHS